MFQREMVGRLQEWAANPSRKPLILRGARQVGKTTLVKEFSHEFDNFISLNLERQSEARIFEQSDSVEEIGRKSCEPFSMNGIFNTSIFGCGINKERMRRLILYGNRALILFLSK